MSKHVFTVGNSHRANYPLSDSTVLSLIAILALTGTNAVTNPRVVAIKTLRSMSGMGLYEAKQIVDYIADNGRIDSNGVPTINTPQPPVVSYRAE